MPDTNQILDQTFGKSTTPSKRISPLQGTGVEPQTIDDYGTETSGTGELLGSVLGSVLGSRGRGGALREEGMAAMGAAIGSGMETIGTQLLHGRKPTLGVDDLVDMAEAAGGSAAGGTAMRGIQKGARKGLDKIPFFKNKVTPEGRNLLKATEELAASTGASPARPAQITDSGVLDILDNVTSMSIGGAGRFNAFQVNQEKILRAGVDAVLTGISPRTRPDKLGKYVVDVIENQQALAESLSGIAYGEVRALTKGKFAKINNIKQFSKDYVKKVRAEGDLVPRLTGSGIAKKASKIGGDIGDDTFTVGSGSVDSVSGIVQALQDKADSLAIPDLIGFRQTLGKIAASYKRNPELENSPAALFISGLITETDKSIQAGLSQFGVDPATRSLYGLAKDGFKKDVVERFRNNIVRGIVDSAKEHPEQLGKVIVEAANAGRGLSVIRAVQGAISKESPAWKRVTRGVLDTIKFSATDPATGRLSGKELFTRMFGPNGFGKDALITALGKTHTSRLMRFTKALITSQEKNPVGTGSVGIQFTQWGLMVGQVTAAVGFQASGREAEAGLVLLGPALLSRLLTSRRGLEVLTKAIETKPTSKEWPRVVSRLLGVVTTEDALQKADQIIQSSKKDAVTKKNGPNVDDILNDMF